MYPILPYGRTVTVLHRYVSGQDQWGNDVYSYTSENVGPCSIQQASSRENINFADQAITGVVVYVPWGTQISYLDAIVVDGTTYEVNAEPDHWTSPFSRRSAPIRVQGLVVKGASP